MLFPSRVRIVPDDVPAERSRSAVAIELQGTLLMATCETIRPGGRS